MSDDSDQLVVLDPGRVRKRAAMVFYSERLGEEICETIGASDTAIETLCRLHRNWPSPQTLYGWRYRHSKFDEGFRAAEAMRASRFMHQCVEIADDDSRDLIQISEGRFIPNTAAVARDRLRIETRREVAKRFDPHTYGDRIEQNVRVGFIPLDDAIHQLK